MRLPPFPLTNTHADLSKSEPIDHNNDSKNNKTQEKKALSYPSWRGRFSSTRASPRQNSGW